VVGALRSAGSFMSSQIGKWRCDEGVDGCEKGENGSEIYWAIDVEVQLEQELLLSELEKTVCVSRALLIFWRECWEKEGWI